MGLTGSKNKKLEDIQEENIPSTPVSTPKVIKNKELDPRSPSTNLSRTPLELLSAAAEKLMELKENEVDILKELENESCPVNDETPVKKKTILLNIDPRSPTIEFKRTPIVIAIEEAAEPTKILNKNLNKVKLYNVMGTPKSTAEKFDTLSKLPPSIVPPKLLESSPIRVNPDANKRKSFVGLLETNIDFTETDLDAVLLEKCKIKEKSTDETATPPRKDYINMIKREDIDPRSPTTDFLRTPIYVVENVDDSELNDKIETEANVLQVMQPKQIGLKLQKHETLKKFKTEEIAQNISEDVEPEIKSASEHLNTYVSIRDKEAEFEEEIVQELEDELFIDNNESIEIVVPKQTKSAPVTPPSKNIKPKYIPVSSPIHKEPKSAPATPPLVNITADVNELDKKLTNLIYQDEHVTICPRIIKLKDCTNRSPLRNCNGNESEKRKSSYKLKVSDKPRKSDFVVSKIPVFKEKAKIQVQCENTPPRNVEKRKVKVKKSYWDSADTTLVI